MRFYWKRGPRRDTRADLPAATKRSLIASRTGMLRVTIGLRTCQSDAFLARWSGQIAALRHPLALERDYLASNIEVGVVVHESQLMFPGEYCGE